ncbi:hypothetical protein [Microvirga sp. TS319]|uniref:hypothetical protein n=1 Tax=Microvirga sp. TS319 TaxID=3241165 RepID=UPI00351A2D1A
MKFIKLSALVLTILPVATASFALMPLPKEEIDALNKAWRAAPFHVQVEILQTRHPPGLDASRCGEITAIVRRSFKGGERLPLGTSVAFDRCITVLDLGFTDFDRDFQPRRKLEAVLADDPVSSGKFVIVRGGMMQIREISEKPQLPLGD